MKSITNAHYVALDAALDKLGVKGHERLLTEVEPDIPLGIWWQVCEDPEDMLRRAVVSRKLLVLAACDCAETVLQYTDDPRSAEAIEVAIAWAAGDASISLRAAAHAAYDAAYDADAAHAAYDAADAAHAAHAASDAAYAACSAARSAARAAARSAAIYAADAVAAAARSAAYAARSAAYAAASYAVSSIAAARRDSLAEMADIVRARITLIDLGKGR